MESSHQTSDIQVSALQSIPDHTLEKTLPSPDSSYHEDDRSSTGWLPDRLERLARLAQDTEIKEQDSYALHHCLDTLESLLLPDPRSSLTQEIIRCRPSNNTRPVFSPKPNAPNSASDDSITTANSNSAQSSKTTPLSQLTALRDDVTMLGVELNKRRNESFHIYKLFSQERQKLSRRVSELENEIHEMRTEMLEDLAEREALQGTVHGLEGWVDGWQAQHDSLLMKKVVGNSRQNGRGWWAKSKTSQRADLSTESLLEGITAWMRGWKDVEEGFRTRERSRTLKRNKRQKNRAMSGINV